LNDVRWAVIGTGTMADRIATAITEAQDSTLQVVVGRTADGAARFAKRHGAPAAAADVARVTADDVDVVYVGSPNELHAAHARLALNADKHVLCDKPVGTNVDDARRLVGLAESRGLRFGANYQNRHHPSLATLNGWLDEGLIGRTVLLRASIAFGHEPLEGWRAQHELAGAAALYNLGVHAIDTLLAVAGELVAEVTALAAPPEATLDRTDVLLLRFARGALATIVASQELVDDEVSIELVGTGGRIRWDGWMSPYREGALVLTSAGGAQRTERSACPRAYNLVVEDFVDAIRSGRDPVPSGQQILETVAVTEAAREAGRSGSTVRV
jgi:predicted dehydrogenase